MKATPLQQLILGGSLLLLAGALSVRAAGTTYTASTTASGDWSTAANWAGGTAPTGNQAGNLAVQGAAGVTLTLDVPATLGQVKDTQGSARNFQINASGTVAMTFDNTGGSANQNGDDNAAISSSSSGAMLFYPNIIITNTDLEVIQTGSTTPSGVIGTLGASTITTSQARNLVLIQNEGKAGQKVFTINSSISGVNGGFLTISNAGPGTGTMLLAGPVGPNASVVEASTAASGLLPSTLELDNSANNYTGPTLVTIGTLLLGANNSIPSVSSVDVAAGATLSLNGKSDVIDALTDAGIVDGISGTPTLTVGGNNGGGTFSGTIQNTAGTLALAKTGTGTEILTGANTYAGATAFNGGILNAGSADAPGSSGPFGSGGTLSFGGGTLQYSAANTQDYSSRFSTAANQGISIDTAGQSVTFATVLASVGGSLTLNDSTGTGTLTLDAAETFGGQTTITSGTLALGAGGALATNSPLSIAAGGTFDVTALGAAFDYLFDTNATLSASGTGTGGTAAATVRPGAEGIFDLGHAQPVSLTWGGAATGSDSTHPALVVAQGTLHLSGNSITVVVPGPALGVGVYTLITAPAITGAPGSIPLFTGGSGLALGDEASLSVVGGTSVVLTVTLSPAIVGAWEVDADGAWTTAADWSSNPNYPRNAGDVAIFGLGSALRTVTLNASESVGALTFSNNNSFVIANGGGTLTLDNKGSGVAVSVTGGAHNAVAAAVALNDNVVVTVAAGEALALAGKVSNAAAVKTLTFNGAGTETLAGANSYGPAAGTVGTTVSGGGTLQVAASTALGAGDVSLSGGSTLQAGAAVSVTNNLDLADVVTVNNNGYNLSLNGTLSGGGSLTKTGAGTLTLNGSNTYIGNTVVEAGVLSLPSANAVTAPAIVLEGGDLLGDGTFALTNDLDIGPVSGPVGTNAWLDAASGQTFTVSGVIASAGNSGANNLIINSSAANAGMVVLSGANTFAGTTVISNGTLDVANPLALQNSVLNYNSGTLVFDGSITAATLAELTGAISLGLTNQNGSPVTLTVGGNNANAEYAGNLSDGGLGGSLVQTGTGTLILSNANHTGNTTIDGSAVLTITGGSFGSSGSTITLGNGGGAATLNVSSGTVTANQLNNGLAGGSTGCAVNLTGSANASFNGVQLGAGGDTSGPLTINTTGSVSLGNLVDYKDIQGTGPATGSGLVIDNGVVTATSVIIQDTTSGADMNLNGGSLTIGNASSTGAFEVGNGASVRGGWLMVTGGTLTYLGSDGLLMMPNASSASGAFFTGGTATLTGITLDDGAEAGANSTLTISNGATVYLGSVGLVDSDPTLTNEVVILGNGTLGAIAPWSSSVPMTLTNTPTLQAADVSGTEQNITLSGILSGSAGLTKTGAGTLYLTGANTYTGPTAINAGTLSLGGLGLLATTNLVVGGGTTFDVSGLSPVFTLVSGQTLTGGGAGATVNGPVNFGSGALAVNYTSGTPALAVAGSITAGNNSVRVNVQGAALGAGNYKLATYSGGGSGSFNATPVITGAGLAGNTAGVITNGNGLISLVVSSSVNPAPTNLVSSYNGTNLTLSWPADHTGWQLQVQTNGLGAGLGTNWYTIPGSTATNQVIAPVSATNATVFFRMFWQPQ
jgi:autotransporter-associated beta strand protein